MADEIPKTYTLGKFLYGINRNKWKQELKKREKDAFSLDEIVEIKGVEIVDVNLDMEYDSEKEKKYELVKKAIDQIGSDCKRLLMDYYHGKIKLKEIAKEMNYTSNFAKQKKRRCLKEVKEKVLDLYEKEL